jgi:hypothetical protein
MRRVESMGEMGESFPKCSWKTSKERLFKILLS